jgi:hypothetical protein
MRRAQCRRRLMHLSTGRWLAGVAGSNPPGDMDVCLLWALCVVRGVCDGLISLAGVSYPVWCVLSVIVKPREWSPDPLWAVRLKKKVVRIGLNPFSRNSNFCVVNHCRRAFGLKMSSELWYCVLRNVRKYSSTLREAPSSTLRSSRISRFGLFITVTGVFSFQPVCSCWDHPFARIMWATLYLAVHLIRTSFQVLVRPVVTHWTLFCHGFNFQLLSRTVGL